MLLCACLKSATRMVKTLGSAHLKVKNNGLNESIRINKQLMSALLTSKELALWIGYEQPARQMTWLRENNISYHLDRFGAPITTLEAVNASLLDRRVSDEVAF